MPRRARSSLRPISAVLVPLVLLAVAVYGGVQPAEAQANSRIALVREGYERLLTLYVQPLPPDALLTEAWNGAAAAAIVAGVNDLPALGVLPADRMGAWAQFAVAYLGLERATAGLISASDLAYAALDTMAADQNECHTYFLPPARFARFRELLAGHGRSIGIGIQLTRTLPFTITYVYPDSPAAHAGLAPGDVIVSVDGIPAAEQTSLSLRGLLAGAKGTQVTLGILRDPELPPQAVTITRGVISIPTLTSELRSDGIGVLTLNVFASDGSSERLLRDALRDLESRGATGWVLDLRANPGGAVESMHNVLGIFLPDDVTATTWVTRTGGRRRFPVTGEAAPVQRPLAVIVGRGSASAAELSAAVLQDTGRAHIFGQRTAACANVGTVGALSDGSGLSVTSARILAGPYERAVDGVGVIPDEVTPLGPADPAMQAAVAYLLHVTAPAGDPVVAAP